MSANVLLVAFGTEISCSEVSSDGYEVINLISSDQTLRRKGFLGERFIKPPVNIYVKFRCPLELSHIVLNGRVGSQKSVGFEIYSQISQPKADVFYPLAKTVSKSEDDQVTFYNPSFQSRAPFTNELRSEIYMSAIKLRHNLSQALTNVSKVQIRITRTLNSCVPALGKLEIWAQPSSNCSKDAALTFYKIYKSVFSLPVSNCAINHVETTREKETSCLPPSDQDIPPEFIDSISCDMMVLPVLLPSGHCVDQTTLDKYLATEASWGRAPNDPFTGVAFNAMKKPLPNSALKGRIDEFLISHQQIAKNVPRTTGRKNAQNECANPKKRFGDEADTSQGLKRLRSYHNNPDNNPGQKKKMKNYSSHEENLKRSLDSSLKQVLNTYPSFTKEAGLDVDSVDADCFSCPHRKSHEVFKLPCTHLICRLCLVKKKENFEMQCDECKNAFNSNGPIRIFL